MLHVMERRGLFRTEFLFMGASELPSEEEQFRAYKAAAETMEAEKSSSEPLMWVVTRISHTLDLRKRTIRS